MISEGLLQYVPGCENGDTPYSQELIGGGRVNRSFLVRTRRGRRCASRRRFAPRRSHPDRATPDLGVIGSDPMTQFSDGRARHARR